MQDKSTMSIYRKFKHIYFLLVLARKSQFPIVFHLLRIMMYFLFTKHDLTCFSSVYP